MNDIYWFLFTLAIGEVFNWGIFFAEIEMYSVDFAGLEIDTDNYRRHFYIRLLYYYISAPIYRKIWIGFHNFILESENGPMIDKVEGWPSEGVSDGSGGVQGIILEGNNVVQSECIVSSIDNIKSGISVETKIISESGTVKESNIVSDSDIIVDAFTKAFQEW